MMKTKRVAFGLFGAFLCMAGCASAPPIPAQDDGAPRLVLEGEPTGPSLFEGCSRGKKLGGVELTCGDEYVVEVRILITNGGASRVFEEAETPLGTRRVRVALESHDAPGFQYKEEVLAEGTGESLGYRRGIQMVIPQDEEDELAFVYGCARTRSTPEPDGQDRCLDYLLSAHAMPIKELTGEE